jgi:hypothetical protein
MSVSGTRVPRFFVLGILAASLVGAAFASSGNNAVPYVDAPLVPTSVKPGGEGFTLTVNGAGFAPGSVVNWNGSPRATVFVSNTRLTATILPSDVTKASTASVTVSNPVPGGGISNVAFFQVANQEPAVGLGIKGACTATPATAADFNGDGKLDLAVFDLSRNNTVSILLGSGKGTFQKHSSYFTDSDPARAVTGDFNGDGKIDLAVTSSGNDGVDVYLGNGDGTFQSRLTSPAGHQPEGIAAGDFDEDGRLDLAVTNAGSDTISILLGNGDGTFQPHVDIDAGVSPETIVVGDFNNDGHLDLIVGNTFSGFFSVFLGNGDGTFQNPISTTIQGPAGLAAGDFNGDGILDLAVVNDAGQGLSVLLGNGDGTFGNPVSYALGSFSWVAIGDFNADGSLDLIANGGNSIGTTSTSVLMGKGDGTFRLVASYTSPILNGSVIIGDFNGDGKLDLDNGCAWLQTPRAVTLNRVSLNFPRQALGTTSSPKSVKLTNSGTQAVGISNITSSGDFSQSNNCPATLDLFKGCIITVTFTPTAIGIQNGAVTITDNGAGSPQTLPLTGTGID